MIQELNRFTDLLLLLEISDLINILLIIITIGTVRYASKTLLMEYSSQIIISRYRIRSQNKEGESYTWEVDIENKGRGYVVKGFILLSIKSSERKFLKQYHLSQPLLDIDPGEKDVIKLELKKTDLDGFDSYSDGTRLEVYYQDAMNNIYVVSPGSDRNNKHLERFEQLPKKIIFPSPRYFIYKHKFKKAIKQENTYVSRKKQEIEHSKNEAIEVYESIGKNTDAN
ncbi:hypothetical protein AB4Y30_08195 [Ornithinibacillus sp. 4-3]|uniref:SMODS-associating 2TM beta-strand rich effector domain-containing protein n=1 Tax=Ornithinibacillus sp. 4-3 TaxID=3231488 RepID=A0AB39HVJ1_9BACI